jgi:NitT/TauT family transport system ATP-binding protein
MHTAGGRARLDVRIDAKSFSGADGVWIEVLRDLAFGVEPGEFVALLGPSGCGKTTALRIILGLDSDYRGEVSRTSGRVGVVFQDPRLLPWRTVEENVRIALSDAESGKPLDRLFLELGLTAMRSRYPSELSLGLARRVALARAFALEPELLVMDEPFVSLDAATGAEMRKVLVGLLERRPATVLMVTHNAREAVELADRLVFLAPRPARVLGEMAVKAPRETRDARFRARILEEIAARFPGVTELA